MATSASSPTAGETATTDPGARTPTVGPSGDDQVSTAEPNTTPKKDLEVVEYTGTADVKILTVSELERVGVTVEQDLVWNGTGDTVPVTSLAAKTVDYFRDQPDFRLS